MSRWETESGAFGKTLRYRIRGTAFLYHMVRRLVGVMAQVGQGLISPGEFEEILRSRDYRQGETAGAAEGANPGSGRLPAETRDGINDARGTARQDGGCAGGKDMNQIVQKTYATTPDVIERRWWVVDAKGMTLGRVASKVAPFLRGTHKALLSRRISTPATMSSSSMPTRSMSLASAWTRRPIIVTVVIPAA